MSATAVCTELLRDEGLIVKVPRLGAFVRKPRDWHTSQSRTVPATLACLRTPGQMPQHGNGARRR